MTMTSDRPAVVPRRYIVLALCAAIVVGAFLRFAAVPTKFAAGECATGDVYRYYVSTAFSWLAGHGFVTDYEWNFIPPPGQAVFVAAVKTAVPSADFGTMRVVQAAFSTLGILLAFGIGRRMRDDIAGVLAAWLIAIDPWVVDYVAILLAESNYLVLLLGFLLALLTATESDRSWRWGIAGLLLGVTSLYKPFPMFLAVVVPVWLVARWPHRKALRHGALFLLGFAIVVTPWLIRNHARYDRVYLISTNAGTLLAQSNFESLDPTDPAMVFWESIYRTDAWKDPDVETRFAGRVDRYGRAEWNEKDRAYMKVAARYVLHHPVHFARNYLVKTYNVFRHPFAAGDGPARPADWYRLLLVVIGLPAVAWYAYREWRRPRSIMVVVFLYFTAFTALMHIVRSGRMNLPVKLLLSFFVAYLLAGPFRSVLGRRRSGNDDPAVVGPRARADGADLVGDQGAEEPELGP